MDFTRDFVNTIKLKLTSETYERLASEFIAFDTETTGLNPSSDRIIELGCVHFTNKLPDSSFGTIVNTDTYIYPSVTAINHITNKMIQQAPQENVVYKAFVKYFEEALNGNVIVVAHNASFDMAFLKATLNRLGYCGTIYYVDTLEMSRRYFPNLINHKQSTLSKYFNVSNDQEHRAYTDALACGNILVKMLDYLKK